MTYITANDANATLAAGISAAATSLSVVAGQGARFPAVAAPDILPVLLSEAGTFEYVNITAHTAGSDTFTIARAVDAYQTGTPTALAFTTAAKMLTVVPKKMLENAEPLYLPTQANNPAAKAGGAQLYVKSYGGRTMLKVMPASGMDIQVQPFMANSQVGLYKPGNGTSVGVGLGINWSSGGTVSHPGIASTSLYAMTRKTRWANVVTTTNQVLGLYTTASYVGRGNGAGQGGFMFVARVAFPLFPAGTRVFVGLTSLQTSGMISVDPSGVAASFIGLGMDIADTNLTIMHRDGTTATTKEVIGAGLARTANQLYDVIIWCAPNSTSINVRVDQISTTGAETVIYDAAISTNLPLATAVLAPNVLMSNGTANTTVTTVAIECASCYLESDF